MTANHDEDAEPQMTSHEFLRLEHLRPRSALYTRFRKQLIDDQLIEGLETQPAVETSIRHLFNAVYNLHGPYPSRPQEFLGEQVELAKVQMAKQLVAANVCNAASAQDLVNDLAGRAKQAALHPPATDKQLAYEGARKKAPIARWHGKRMPRPKVPYAELGVSGVAHLDKIKADSHEAALLAQQCRPFWQAIQSHDYSQDLMHSLFKYCQSQSFDKDAAVAVCATLLETFIERDNKFRHDGDLTPIRDAVILPAMCQENESSIRRIAYQLEADGALSQGLTVVLLAAQKHVAHEAAIDMVRAIERKEIERPTAQGFAKVQELMHQHFLPLNGVIEQLAKQHMVSDSDLLLLKRHQTNIFADASDFLKQHAGRSAER